MSDVNDVASVEDVTRLEAGQWVVDADGKQWCLVDTNFGWPQRMWMHKRHMTHLTGVAYPLRLADFQGDCVHRWGSNEMGHCYRCGVVVDVARPKTFDEPDLELIRSVAEHNARIEEGK